MTERTKQVALLGLVLYLLGGSVEAIIIRHDKGYQDYEVREVDFPAVFFLESQDNRRICAGTLIDPGWAITAAHCIGETGLRNTLVSGEPFQVRLAGRDRTIVGVVIHPDFVPDTPDEVDLALLRFEQPLEYPVPMQLYRNSDESGQVVDLVGWGYFGLGTTGRQYSDGAIRRARNRIESAGSRLLIRFDDPRQRLDAVQDLEGMPGLGDSGGPALLAGPQGWWLTGVAVGELKRRGVGEEQQGCYGAEAVYERISSHLEWIDGILLGDQVSRTGE